mgnify:FL=1
MSTLLPLAQLKTITKRNDVRVAEEPAPAWLTREWWQQALAQLPERVCERVADHGSAYTYYTASFAGQSVGYHCHVCGWDKAALVQEGGQAPCAPSPALPAARRRKVPVRVSK